MPRGARTKRPNALSTDSPSPRSRIVPSSSWIVAEIVSPRERGRYQGYIQMVFVVASVAGPLLGGLFADHLSWRWVFYVILPIGAAALALIMGALRLPDRREPARVDYLGGALLAGALTCI